MSLNVEIIQNGLIKKTLPLEVILGDELDYGTFDSAYRLEEHKLGNSGFVAYNPKSIARGFSVDWTPDEKQKVALSLPLFTTDSDIADLMHCVKRIADYWKGCQVLVDEEATTAEDFAQRFDELCAMSAGFLKQCLEQLLSRESQSFYVIGAKLPLALGYEEAKSFAEADDCVAALTDFMHERQSLDAYYPSPRLYQDKEGGILGVIYYFTSIRCILPLVPSIPLGMVAQNGEPLKPDRWLAVAATDGQAESVSFESYEPMLALLPKEKCSRFDANHIVVEALTQEEHDALVAGASKSA